MQLERRRVREFRSFAESAVVRVESLQGGFDLRIHQPYVPVAMRPGEKLRLRYGADESPSSLLDLGAARAIGLRGTLENAAEARPAHGIFRRKVRAAVKRPAVREQKDRERPAARAGHGADSGLVARIDVGTFVAIHFDGNVEPIDQLRQARIVITFAINDVAPVAPDRADVQKYGLVFGTRPRERLIAPFVPSHGLVRGGMQIGAGGIRQAVWAVFVHGFLSRRENRDGLCAAFLSADCV